MKPSSKPSRHTLSPIQVYESHFALRRFARRSRYLRHTCLHAWSHPHRCGRRCPWSLNDSCMSRCHGYRQSTAGGRCINKYKIGKACATRGNVSRLFAAYRSLVVAGVLESSDAGFTVGAVKAFAALCNLRNTCTHTDRESDRREWIY